jgi:hypothetical protein
MLEMANYDDETLRKMGQNGRAKMETEYDEKIVAEKYLTTLHSL